MEIKEQIEGLFPCRWEGDFLRAIRNTFDRYIEIVSEVSGNNIEDIKRLCDALEDVVKKYYSGCKGEAFVAFRDIMDGNKEKPGLFSSIENLHVHNGIYYRARERKIGVEFTIQDMFHIPLNKRGIVSTKRYSSPGYPCLYLGNSVYSCWEEMRRCLFDNLMFSAYKVQKPFMVVDVRIPRESDYNTEKLPQTLKRLPLVLACSFVVGNYDDVFKPEYIIPQLLVESIICRNRKFVQNKSIEMEASSVWGVIYTSTHISKDFPYGRNFLENIVLPVVQSEAKTNYCPVLASLFEISQPLCYEYEALKENTTRLFWDEDDQEKTAEEKMRERYVQSKMGYLEEKLKKAHFMSLP